MDQDRVVGAVRNVGGKVEEGLGRVVGDAKTQAEGVVDQAAGKALEVYGQAKDAAADDADSVQKGAKDADDYIRKLIEDRPYTVAMVALGVGWLIGRMGGRSDHHW